MITEFLQRKLSENLHSENKTREGNSIKMDINLLAPKLFFLNFSTPVYKM